jgi:uncharacterized membrane protein
MMKGSDRNVLAYLIAMAGIAIVALGIGLILIAHDREATGRTVIGIATIAIGGLVAVGPAVVRRNGNGRR